MWGVFLLVSSSAEYKEVVLKTDLIQYFLCCGSDDSTKRLQ